MNQGPDEALPNPGKAVTSTAPAGPRDMSGDLQRHREQPDASVTSPPGGYPTTVGGNPNPPTDPMTSDDCCGTVSAPGPYSLATQWVGEGANY